MNVYGKQKGTVVFFSVKLSEKHFLELILGPVKVLSVSAKLSTTRKEETIGEAAMASIPFASYSAAKIHKNVKDQFEYDGDTSGQSTNKMFHQNILGIDKVLTNYNSKLMNSIWGQYNLYAAHAFQKNNEGSCSGINFLNVPQVKDLWDSLRTAH